MFSFRRSLASDSPAMSSHFTPSALHMIPANQHAGCSPPISSATGSRQCCGPACYGSSGDHL